LADLRGHRRGLVRGVESGGRGGRLRTTKQRRSQHLLRAILLRSRNDPHLGGVGGRVGRGRGRGRARLDRGAGRGRVRRHRGGRLAQHINKSGQSYTLMSQVDLGGRGVVSPPWARRSGRRWAPRWARRWALPWAPRWARPWARPSGPRSGRPWGAVDQIEQGIRYVMTLKRLDTSRKGTYRRWRGGGLLGRVGRGRGGGRLEGHESGRGQRRAGHEGQDHPSGYAPAWARRSGRPWAWPWGSATGADAMMRDDSRRGQSSDGDSELTAVGLAVGRGVG
jgi:hypothetical protein